MQNEGCGQGRQLPVLGKCVQRDPWICSVRRSGTFFSAVGVWSLRLGTVVAAVLYTLGQAGFVSLAYSEINRSAKMRNTLFWANIVSACSMVLLANAVIYVVVIEPDRRIFIICLVSTLVLSSVSEVANVSLLTARRFRALAAKQFTVQTIGAAAALLAAYGGSGAWSLVIQRCVGGILEIILVFALLRWRPTFLFDYAEFKRLLPTAIGFAGNSSLSTLETRLADFVIATVSTLDQLAAYRIAARVFDTIDLANHPANCVGYERHYRGRTFQPRRRLSRPCTAALVGRCLTVCRPPLLRRYNRASSLRSDLG